MIGNRYSYFVNCARGLDGFIVGQKEDVPYDITELINGYCQAKDNNDQVKMSQYISALFVRYWHVVVMLYNQSLSTRLEFDDIISWVYDAFEKAAYYRSWLDNTKEVSKSPKGAEKCINQCITSVRQFWYKHFNQEKRKVNFISSSLDDVMPLGFHWNFDTPMTILDTVADESETELVDTGKEIIKNYVSSGKLFEALVLDGILYQDCFFESTSNEVVDVDEEGNDVEVTKYHSEFSPIKLKKHLKNLNSAFISYFVEQYGADRDGVKNIYDSIISSTKAQLSTRVNKAFKSFKNNKEIKNWLCL